MLWPPVTGTALLELAGGVGLELVVAGLLKVSTAVDVVVDGASVMDGEELSMLDPGEAEVRRGCRGDECIVSERGVCSCARAHCLSS
jgi:hypothetical protein